MKAIQCKELLKSGKEELKALTAPPLCADFEKESREDAIRKREVRKNMVTEEVPPTAESNFITQRAN